MHRHLFIILFLLGSLWSSAQESGTIRGTVWDFDSRQPISGISVYINGTTFSTQTQKDGSFSLAELPLSLFELTISAINYETQAVSIDLTKEAIPLNIYLKKSTAVLDEVVVKTVAARNDWSVHGSTFKKDFLGYSAFSKKCEILNYTDIKFRTIKKNNSLLAYSKVPVTIKNMALGYEITYWLEAYEHQFLQQIVSFKGYSHFTELKGSRKQQSQWEKNRGTAYNGSLTHFLKALYEGKTTAEGFVVNLIKSVNFGSLNLYLPTAEDSINNNQFEERLRRFLATQADTSNNRSYTSQASIWIADPYNTAPLSFAFKNSSGGYDVYYCVKDRKNETKLHIYKYKVSSRAETGQIHWQSAGNIIPDQKAINRVNGLEHLSQDQKNNQKIQLYFTQPLNPNDFKFQNNENTYLQFRDSWQVTYTKELQETEYVVEQSLDKNYPSYQTSTLTMAGTAPIRILPNGFTPDAYSLITGAYWSYEKIDKMLPANFKPN